LDVQLEWSTGCSVSVRRAVRHEVSWACSVGRQPDEGARFGATAAQRRRPGGHRGAEFERLIDRDPLPRLRRRCAANQLAWAIHGGLAPAATCRGRYAADTVHVQLVAIASDPSSGEPQRLARQAQAIATLPESHVS
jgi:hypothetical protein